MVRRVRVRQVREVQMQAGSSSLAAASALLTRGGEGPAGEVFTTFLHREFGFRRPVGAAGFERDDVARRDGAKVKELEGHAALRGFQGFRGF